MKQFGNIPVQCKGRKLRKSKRASSTTGKSKGLLPTTQERAFAAYGRSYKQKGYADWAERTRLANKGDTRRV